MMTDTVQQWIDRADWSLCGLFFAPQCPNASVSARCLREREMSFADSAWLNYLLKPNQRMPHAQLRAKIMLPRKIFKKKNMFSTPSPVQVRSFSKSVGGAVGRGKSTCSNQKKKNKQTSHYRNSSKGQGREVRSRYGVQRPRIARARYLYLS